MPLPEDEVNQMFEDAWKHQEDNDQQPRESKKSKQPKEIFLQRIINNEVFAEAVIIDGIAKFLIANNGTGEISTVGFIPLVKNCKTITIRILHKQTIHI